MTSLGLVPRSRATRGVSKDAPERAAVDAGWTILSRPFVLDKGRLRMRAVQGVSEQGRRK
jgi:hypothetical protein